MGLLLRQRINEAIKSLPMCSASDVKVTSDENTIVFNFKDVLDKYYFLEDEIESDENDENADLDWAQLREIQSEEEKCWDDFVLEFIGSFQDWAIQKITYLPKKMLEDFKAINKARPFFKIVGERESLFRIATYNEEIYEISYPLQWEIKDTAGCFTLDEILYLMPKEKKRIEENNIILLETDEDGFTTETPEAEELRNKFEKEMKRWSKDLFKELAKLLVADLPSFLDQIPEILAECLVNYNLPDISL